MCSNYCSFGHNKAQISKCGGCLCGGGDFGIKCVDNIILLTVLAMLLLAIIKVVDFIKLKPILF